MKLSRAFVSISLAVVGGFVVGMVAFNLYTPRMVALGASGPSDPNSALKSVTHNATLTGDGTTAAPLGIANGGVGTLQIANGAVTSSKLGAGSPSAGQLLSFNGTGLAWQVPPTATARVVDSLGHDVGPLIYFNGYTYALRRVGALTFRLNVDQSGFFNEDFTFYYTSTDCSGLRYLYGDAASLIRYSGNSSTQVYFATEPFQVLQMRSFETTREPGICRSPYSATFAAGLAGSMSLSALGLTPPFHLEF